MKPSQYSRLAPHQRVLDGQWTGQQDMKSDSLLEAHQLKCKKIEQSKWGEIGMAGILVAPAMVFLAPFLDKNSSELITLIEMTFIISFALGSCCLIYTLHLVNKLKHVSQNSGLSLALKSQHNNQKRITRFEFDRFSYQDCENYKKAQISLSISAFTLFIAGGAFFVFLYLTN
jgi:hypothetical protein